MYHFLVLYFKIVVKCCNDDDSTFRGSSWVSAKSNPREMIQKIMSFWLQHSHFLTIHNHIYVWHNQCDTTELWQSTFWDTPNVHSKINTLKLLRCRSICSNIVYVTRNMKILHHISIVQQHRYYVIKFYESGRKKYTT